MKKIAESAQESSSENFEELDADRNDPSLGLDFEHLLSSGPIFEGLKMEESSEESSDSSGLVELEGGLRDLVRGKDLLLLEGTEEPEMGKDLSLRKRDSKGEGRGECEKEEQLIAETCSRVERSSA